MELDWSVGQIVREIDEAGLTNDTWILFTSDNGPWLSYGNHAGSAGELREGKHTVFEGGTRVPTVMRLPGVIPAGEVIDSNVMNIDVLPSFAALIQADLPEHPIDGRDVWPLLRSEPGAVSPHDAYYFWYGGSLEAVLQGRYKLHFPHSYPTVVAPGMDGQAGQLQSAELPLSLFDVADDPGERLNLLEEHPDVVERMSALATEHELQLLAGKRAAGRL
jgi:arylsulfatase A